MRQEFFKGLAIVSMQNNEFGKTLCTQNDTDQEGWKVGRPGRLESRLARKVGRRAIQELEAIQPSWLAKNECTSLKLGNFCRLGSWKVGRPGRLEPAGQEGWAVSIHMQIPSFLTDRPS
ncbi:putative unconventional myosin-XVB-like isoform X1 [Sesbania bispinosa]|nr:putative unconventional myosin-XVB-like isoform X1 [Sesbania bispinosa]